MINQRSAKRRMPQPAARKITAIFALAILSIFLVAISSTSRAAEAPVGLGTTASFAVLAGTTVTNTGPTVVNGDLGVSPGTAITGFPPGIVVNGTTHSADGVAAQAQSHLTTAYNDAAGRDCSPTNDLTDQDLGGMTLTPGVYCYSSSAQLTGTVTLNTEGDPAAVFIFQIGSTLTTASDSSVSFINGESCNVFWQVGSSATLGTDTAFNGNILALTSIGLDTGATIVNGRTLARNGAVTLDTNTIDRSACAPTPTPTPTPTDAPTPTPTPTGTPASTPTPTPLLPLPGLTPTPQPTAAPAATATPTPTQASTPTPAPALIATAAPSSTPMSTPMVSVLGIGGSREGSESGSGDSALPRTGASIRMLVLLGLGLIVSGEFLRRRARKTRH